jgi:hypothetical protein
LTRNASKVWEDFFRPPPNVSQEIQTPTESLSSFTESSSSFTAEDDNQEEIEMIFAHLDEELFSDYNNESIIKEAEQLVTKLEALPESPHEEIENVVRDVSKRNSNTLERRITLRTVLQVVSKQADDVEERIRSSSVESV